LARMLQLLGRFVREIVLIERALPHFGQARIPEAIKNDTLANIREMKRKKELDFMALTERKGEIDDILNAEAKALQQFPLQCAFLKTLLTGHLKEKFALGKNMVEVVFFEMIGLLEKGLGITALIREERVIAAGGAIEIVRDQGMRMIIPQRIRVPGEKKPHFSDDCWIGPRPIASLQPFTIESDNRWEGGISGGYCNPERLLTIMKDRPHLYGYPDSPLLSEEERIQLSIQYQLQLLSQWQAYAKEVNRSKTMLYETNFMNCYVHFSPFFLPFIEGSPLYRDLLRQARAADVGSQKRALETVLALAYNNLAPLTLPFILTRRDGRLCVDPDRLEKISGILPRFFQLKLSHDFGGEKIAAPPEPEVQREIPDQPKHETMGIVADEIWRPFFEGQPDLLSSSTLSFFSGFNWRYLYEAAKEVLNEQELRELLFIDIFRLQPEIAEEIFRKHFSLMANTDTIPSLESLAKREHITPERAAHCALKHYAMEQGWIFEKGDKTRPTRKGLGVADRVSALTSTQAFLEQGQGDPVPQAGTLYFWPKGQSDWIAEPGMRTMNASELLEPSFQTGFGVFQAQGNELILSDFMKIQLNPALAKQPDFLLACDGAQCFIVPFHQAQAKAALLAEDCIVPPFPLAVLKGQKRQLDLISGKEAHLTLPVTTGGLLVGEEIKESIRKNLMAIQKIIEEKFGINPFSRVFQIELQTAKGEGPQVNVSGRKLILTNFRPALSKELPAHSRTQLDVMTRILAAAPVTVKEEQSLAADAQNVAGPLAFVRAVRFNLDQVFCNPPLLLDLWQGFHPAMDPELELLKQELDEADRRHQAIQKVLATMKRETALIHQQIAVKKNGGVRLSDKEKAQDNLKQRGVTGISEAAIQYALRRSAGIAYASSGKEYLPAELFDQSGIPKRKGFFAFRGSVSLLANAGLGVQPTKEEKG